MACPAIITGDQFLVRVLTHVDCQAQLIGSYGYQALGEPGSLAATIMTGLLTLFVALFGIRLMFGPPPGARDVVYSVLKIGIVLTLAFSWPAFRTLVYDVTLHGPAEIAQTLTTASQGQSAGGLTQRLQNADTAMVRLTELGTGRNTGEFLDGEVPGGTFEGTALRDESTLGWARLAYLAGIIGSLALLRIAAGLLLALAPLAAGLLLFEQTRGLFAGWLKGLLLAIVGATGATLVLTVELAVLEPWLADAVRVRGLGYATPSAPTELLAMTLGFAIAQFAMIWLLARVAFYRGWPDLSSLRFAPMPAQAWEHRAGFQTIERTAGPNRAEGIGTSVAATMRREESREVERLSYRTIDGGPAQTGQNGSNGNGGQSVRLGSSYRRNAERRSIAGSRRDRDI